MAYDIFNEAVRCMDAVYQNSPADFLENSDIVDRVDALIMEFRTKFEIPNSVEIGNADAVETNWDAYNKAKTQMEVKIFEMCWELMQEAMNDWGLGEIARDVFASQILGIKPTWDKKAEAIANSTNKSE